MLDHRSLARPFVRLKFLFNALVLISDHVIWVYALGSGVKKEHGLSSVIGHLCALEEVRSMRISLKYSFCC